MVDGFPRYFVDPNRNILQGLEKTQHDAGTAREPEVETESGGCDWDDMDYDGEQPRGANNDMDYEGGVSENFLLFTCRKHKYV
jgi:hypothetical protein